MEPDFEPFAPAFWMLLRRELAEAIAAAGHDVRWEDPDRGGRAYHDPGRCRLCESRLSLGNVRRKDERLAAAATH